MSTSIRNPQKAPGAARVAQLVEEVIRSRDTGSALPDDDVIAAHPDLMPELGEKLHALRQVEEAARLAEMTGSGSERSAQSMPVAAFGDATQLADAPTLPSDSFVGYQLLREVHRGGQGVVYQAMQKSTQRKVAIKVMKEGPFAGPGDRARFEREVQILGQLQHPNIVAVHDSGTAAGAFYFVMDYIAGQSLDVYMASGQRTINETLVLFAKICGAVNAAHLRGIIHRDLKPSNIRVDAEGEPRILDFGLAKLATPLSAPADGGMAIMTLTGQFVGSLPWASPEQAEGIPSKIDIRTDVYSLGVILYQMLTAKFPYEVVGNMRDVLDRILKAEPARPSTIRKQVNDEVETIVLKCLAKERERRYQSAGELSRDVGRYLAGEPIEAKRDSALYLLRKQVRRFRVPLAIAAGFLLVLIASSVVAWVLYGQARSRLWESYLSAARAHRATAVPGRKTESLEALRLAAAIRPTREVRDEAIAALGC